MPLRIELVIRQIHSRVGVGVEIITAVEHACPNAPLFIFINAPDGIGGELLQMDKLVFCQVIPVDAIAASHIYLSVSHNFDTIHCAVFSRRGIFQQWIVLDYLPRFDVHAVNPVDDMSNP